MSMSLRASEESLASGVFMRFRVKLQASAPLNAKIRHATSTHKAGELCVPAKAIIFVLKHACPEQRMFHSFLRLLCRGCLADIMCNSTVRLKVRLEIAGARNHEDGHSTCA